MTKPLFATLEEVAAHNARIHQQQRERRGLAVVEETPVLLKEAKRFFSLVLPWPPTTNHSHYGNHHLTDETRHFRSVVAGICANRCIQPLAGRLSLAIICYQADNKMRDIGNLEKQTSDALVACGMIKDENIDHIEIDRLRITHHENNITVMVREI